MEKLYEEGHIRTIGVCNFNQHHLKLMEATEVVPYEPDRRHLTSISKHYKNIVIAMILQLLLGCH